MWGRCPNRILLILPSAINIEAAYAISTRARRKAVDRAKGVLMQQLKLSEAEAFRWIQKTAMDRRLGMREVAEAVITGLPKT